MNKDIKERAAAANVRLWMVADALGIADTTFSKKLRKELSEDEKKHIFDVIDDLSKEDN